MATKQKASKKVRHPCFYKKRVTECDGECWIQGVDGISWFNCSDGKHSDRYARYIAKSRPIYTDVIRKAIGSESREYIIRVPNREKIMVIYEMYKGETTCPHCKYPGKLIALEGKCTRCLANLRIVKKPKGKK